MVGKISILTASEISICFDYSLRLSKMAKDFSHPLYFWIPRGRAAEMLSKFSSETAGIAFFSSSSLGG